MTGQLAKLWTDLSAGPLLWLALTLAVFQLAAWLFRRFNFNPLLNPVLISIVVLVAILKIADADYASYFKGSQFIHFLLGPATVALAIPLYREVARIKKSLLPIMAGLVAGSFTGIASAVGIGWLLGGNKVILLTLAPKSVTTPIAIGIADQIGGLRSLTAVTVVLTGVAGAVFGDWVLKTLKVTDESACGMAFGVASHGVGTAHAMKRSRVVGAFSALAMGMNGLFTALTLPALVLLVG